MKVHCGLKKQFYIAMLCVPAAFLPGCAPVDWIKNMFKGGAKAEMAQESSAKAEKPSETKPTAMPAAEKAPGVKGQVLVTINGKPIVTTESFEHEFEQLLEENPQLRSILAFMPDAKRNFLTGLINQEIVDMYIKDRGIDKKAEYKADFDRTMRSVERMLNTKYFAAAHPVQVTDADIKDFYDKNKDTMHELVVSRGGVQTSAVQFDNEAAAQAFSDKVKGKSGQFDDVVKEQSLTDKMKDFKLVNKTSVGIDPILKNKVQEVTTFPSTGMVKVNDKTVYVYNVTKKEDAKYRPYEEVKEALRQLVEREKTNERLQKEINEAAKTMNVVINEDYFKQEAAPQTPASMPQMGKEATMPKPQASKTAGAKETKVAAPTPVARAA